MEENNPPSNISILKNKNYIYIIAITLLILVMLFAGGIYWWQISNIQSAKKSCQQEIISLKNQINLLQQAEIKQKENNNVVADQKCPTLIWSNFTSKELNISFEYPITGETNYEYREGPEQNSDLYGIFYSWNIKRKDTGYTYSFAGGVSKEFEIGGDRWITYNYQWVQKSDKYYIQQGGGEDLRLGIFEYLVNPIKIITRSDGLKGLIFDPNTDFFPEGMSSHKLDKAAILNFPTGYHNKINSITFYFYDDIPLEDIEKVLRSVQFQK